MSENIVPYMLRHCFLKYKLARDMTNGMQQVMVIASINLDSQIDEYYTGVAQF